MAADSRLLGSALLCVAILVASIERPHAQLGGLDSQLELIDPKVLRVCADPNNLPFSNEKGEGFENKIAEMLAAKLDRKLAYAWYPQATGFVRNTLSAYRCDLIPGFPQGDELVQSTNPYYRTAYALIVKPGAGLDDVDTLSDPRLKEKRIGIVAGTPPATYLAVDGLMRNAKPYPLVVDTRVDSSGQAMMRDLASGEIDVGILWGPMAGYYASRASPPLRVVLLLNETRGPQLVFRIAIKPTSSTPKEQNTLNWETGKVENASVKGRHDLCIALRVPVILEAVTAIVLADLAMLEQKIPRVI